MNETDICGDCGHRRLDHHLQVKDPTAPLGFASHTGKATALGKGACAVRAKVPGDFACTCRHFKEPGDERC